MIKRVLKNKLVALGYAATYVESKMKELNVAIDTSQYTESELIQKIEVFFYEKRTRYNELKVNGNEAENLEKAVLFILHSGFILNVM